MDKKRLVNISKFLSFVLRHQPEAIGIKLDQEGWVLIETLLWAANNMPGGLAFDHAMLQEVVDTNEKKRFTISEDGKRIRAAQGHSTEQVQQTLEAKEPPALLYHGTATRFVESIAREGLKPGERHHVHLSDNIETAITVGQRHGKASVLEVRAGDMHKEGLEFYQADNGVWLTNAVPVEFLLVVTGRRERHDMTHYFQPYSLPQGLVVLEDMDMMPKGPPAMESEKDGVQPLLTDAGDALGKTLNAIATTSPNIEPMARRNPDGSIDITAWSIVDKP